LLAVPAALMPPTDELGCAQAAALSATSASDTAIVGVPPLGRRIQGRARWRDAMVNSRRRGWETV
jgi:hypothetical protein